MDTIFDTFRPAGFHTMSPYLFVADPPGLIDFLKKTFWATEKSRTLTSSGDIANCIMQIGDTSFMISQARGEFEGMRTSFYLYVSDVDQVYQNALKQGAKISFAPADMPYGDRQGGIIDPAGNYWWISKRLVEEEYHD